MSARRRLAIGIAVLAAAGAGIAAAQRGGSGLAVTRLVTDARDAKLVNAWGLAASPTGPWWVANEARDASTLYAASGQKQALDDLGGGRPDGHHVLRRPRLRRALRGCRRTGDGSSTPARTE